MVKREMLKKTKTSKSGGFVPPFSGRGGCITKDKHGQQQPNQKKKQNQGNKHKRHQQDSKQGRRGCFSGADAEVFAFHDDVDGKVKRAVAASTSAQMSLPDASGDHSSTWSTVHSGHRGNADRVGKGTRGQTSGAHRNSNTPTIRRAQRHTAFLTTMEKVRAELSEIRQRQSLLKQSILEEQRDGDQDPHGAAPLTTTTTIPTTLTTSPIIPNILTTIPNTTTTTTVPTTISINTIPTTSPDTITILPFIPDILDAIEEDQNDGGATIEKSVTSVDAEGLVTTAGTALTSSRRSKRQAARAAPTRVTRRAQPRRLL